MSRGILMFAHNNGLFNYGKMAYAAACAASYYLHEPISLVTDEKTWEQLWDEFPGVTDFFDQRIFVETDGVNKRHFDMVDGTTKKAQYHNTTRFQAYDLSPYDETLMLDTDVLIQDDSLKNVWGGAPIRMNRRVSEMVKSAHGYAPTVQRLQTNSLPIFWATICYFRKSHLAEQFFALCNYVIENYDYYGVLYGFPTLLLRVDFVHTIAAHIMCGYIEETRSVIDTLPKDNTLFAWNKDILVDVQKGRATFFTKVHGSQLPVVVRQTVHCMNKDSMLANADRIIECYA